MAGVQESDLGKKLQDAAQQAFDALKRKSGKVLVVDDDHAICEVVTEGLKAQGYDAFNVIVSNDGADYIWRIASAVRERDIDVILYDINLPHPNNGPALAMAVEQRMRAGTIPYALTEMFTGYKSKEDVEGMLDGFKFTIPPRTYLKDQVLTGEKDQPKAAIKLANYLRERVETGRSLRKVINDGNQVRDKFYRALIQIQQFSGELLGHKDLTLVRPTIVDLVTQFETDLGEDYKRLFRTYFVEDFVGDLGRINVVRVNNVTNNYGKITPNIELAFDADSGVERATLIEPSLRRLPALLESLGQQAAMYTQGDYTVILAGSKQTNHLKVGLRARLIDSINHEERKQQIENYAVSMSEYFKHLGCAAKGQVTERNLWLNMLFTNAYRQ
ncbi:response regulator [Candidatus Woesearchaeota archaeon]|nr:response regulator [Candidatus Woesearchaeota archaeon]